MIIGQWNSISRLHCCAPFVPGSSLGSGLPLSVWRYQGDDLNSVPQQSASASRLLGLPAMDKMAICVYMVIRVVEVFPHIHQEDLSFGSTPTKNSGEQCHGVRLYRI